MVQTPTKLHGPMDKTQRERFIENIYRRLNEKGIPVKRKALNGLLGWSWETIRNFAASAGIPTHEFLRVLERELETMVEYHPRPLPPLREETAGERLAEARRHCRRAQHDFARIGGIGPENISRYERNMRMLRNAELKTILGIALTLNCPLRDVYEHILRVPLS